MPSISSIVDLVHPVPSGIGVITSDTIWIVFDREIDENSITDGNFFITGPDFSTMSGPDLQLFLDTEGLDETEILESPGYHGFVQGAITFQRLALDSLTEVSTQDTIGSGLLYRTKAIFTPTNRLQANVEYNVYLSGDEDSTDILNTGISSRTIFDPIESGLNTGTGDVTFDGTYIGLVTSDICRITITTAGDVGTAKFTFHYDSDPSFIYGPFRTKRSGVLLTDGITVNFTEGTYVVGDKWSVLVKDRDVFSGNIDWPFITGSASIVTVPDTVATSIIGDPVTTTESISSSTFTVSSVNPDDESSNYTVAGTEAFDIVVEFSSAIDDATVVDGTDISVFTESVTGETDVIASGELLYTSSVDESTLTITVGANQIYENNLITVTLDSTIAGTNNVSLGSDYSFWFTTTYNPMYCTLRQTRMRIGAFIADVSDDTVNLAIHMASKETSYLTWNTTDADSDYYYFARSQWVCCKAAETLLLNTTGGLGSLKSKRLGDLQVEYNTNAGTAKPLQKVENCLARWEGALMAGGQQVQAPTMVVKGESDIDRPPIGRGWFHSRNLDAPSTPSANQRSIFGTSRRYYHVYSRRGWWNR